MRDAEREIRKNLSPADRIKRKNGQNHVQRQLKKGNMPKNLWGVDPNCPYLWPNQARSKKKAPVATTADDDEDDISMQDESDDDEME